MICGDVFVVAVLCSCCLVVGRQKTAARHSCHMLQVRDFKGTLLEIGLNVGRNVSLLSSWTCRSCGRDSKYKFLTSYIKSDSESIPATNPKQALVLRI